MTKTLSWVSKNSWNKTIENNNFKYVKVQGQNAVRLNLELSLKEGFIEEITEEIMCELSFSKGIQ